MKNIKILKKCIQNEKYKELKDLDFMLREIWREILEFGSRWFSVAEEDFQVRRKG